MNARRRIVVAALFAAATLPAGIAAQPRPENVEVEPVTCWWRTRASAVRVGEPFAVLLTCSVLETEAAKAVIDRSRLGTASVQFPPFEVMGGSQADDHLTPGRRFIQYEYLLRLVNEDSFSRDIAIEKIVFHDKLTTTHPADGSVLRCVTSEEDIRTCMEQRQGGGEWLLELDGKIAGKGGILFHYNRPYGDLYMNVDEPFRRRGLGSFLVQELKKLCYELGAVPCARCDPANIASRQTLQTAGFVPFAQILAGSIATTSV
jgi:GNAT superfamily N-acetyltransferase